MLRGAGTGASEVPPHGPREQFRGPFLAFGGRHRRLAGARLGRGGSNQGACSGFVAGGPGSSSTHQLARAVSVSRAETHLTCQAMAVAPK